MSDHYDDPDLANDIAEIEKFDANETDFKVQNEGSIYILYAVSDRAQSWVEGHLPEDRQQWGVNGSVIEHRYVCDIIDGIREAALTIEAAS